MAPRSPMSESRVTNVRKDGRGKKAPGARSACEMDGSRSRRGRRLGSRSRRGRRLPASTVDQDGDYEDGEEDGDQGAEDQRTRRDPIERAGRDHGDVAPQGREVSGPAVTPVPEGAGPVRDREVPQDRGPEEGRPRLPRVDPRVVVVIEEPAVGPAVEGRQIESHIVVDLDFDRGPGDAQGRVRESPSG